MYRMHMIRINRSPDGGEGNGGADASGDLSASSGAGEGSADTGSAGGNAQPEYLTKSDFEAFSTRMEQTLSRLTPAQREAREEKTDKDGDKPAKRPNAKDYDFAKDPAALERYEDDMDSFRRSQWDADRQTKETARQAEERSQKNFQGHNARVAAYRKENTSFDADMKSARIGVTDPVAAAVYASKNGHLVVHYMAKNPGTDQELNLLADTDGPEAVRERIGEIVSDMKAEQKLSEDTREAAGARPPRQNLRGGAGGSNESSKDYGKIFKDFRK